MAQIVQEPQLRFTSDQMAICEMLVEFSERGSQPTLSRLKVVGWGNLAQEIQKSYHQGDRVVIEGRLTINSVQAEGYKEKRAELTVQKIYPLGAGVNLGSVSSTDTSLNATNEEEMRSPVTAERPIIQLLQQILTMKRAIVVAILLAPKPQHRNQIIVQTTTTFRFKTLRQLCL